MSEKVHFKHLYGDVYAYFPPKRYRWDYLRIVMPQDFIPEVGVEYEVDFQETKAGEFVYNNTRYRLVRAHLVSTATILDQIDYSVKNQMEEPESQGAVGLALERAGLGRETSLGTAFRRAGLVDGRE